MKLTTISVLRLQSALHQHGSDCPNRIAVENLSVHSNFYFTTHDSNMCPGHALPVKDDAKFSISTLNIKNLCRLMLLTVEHRIGLESYQITILNQLVDNCLMGNRS